MLGVSVDVPGPPPVRIKSVSTTLNASIRRSTPMTASSGVSIGKVKRQTLCKPAQRAQARGLDAQQHEEQAVRGADGRQREGVTGQGAERDELAGEEGVG